MAGDGGTIAIVASGLDKVHPYENIPLQEEILRKGGLVLLEQPSFRSGLIVYKLFQILKELESVIGKLVFQLAGVAEFHEEAA